MIRKSRDAVDTDIGGKITEVMTPPGNDVYVVKGSHEYMIPAVKEFVEEINVQEGYVKVRLIEGMQTDAD